MAGTSLRDATVGVSTVSGCDSACILTEVGNTCEETTHQRDWDERRKLNPLGRQVMAVGMPSHFRRKLRTDRVAFDTPSPGARTDTSPIPAPRYPFCQAVEPTGSPLCPMRVDEACLRNPDIDQLCSF